MNPADIEQVIEQNLTALDVETKQINEDPDLSRQGRNKALAAIQEHRHELARSQADYWLHTLTDQANAASETYVSAQKAHHNAVDPQSRLTALEYAKPTATAGRWEEISAAVNQAVELQDPQTLQAWRSLAPVVAERFGSDSPHYFDANTLGTRISEELANLEPEDLRQAREQSAAADESLQRGRDRLGTYDFAAEMRGQSPLFKDITHPRSTIISGGPDQDHWSFQSTNWLQK